MADLDFKKQLGVNLREAREHADISVESMAAALGCSPTTVYAYERGQNLAPIPVVAAYARLSRRLVDSLIPDGCLAEPAFRIGFLHDDLDVSALTNGRLTDLMERAVQEVRRRLP